MSSTPVLIAADIGNSRVKLGRFDRVAACVTALTERPLPIAGPPLPEPSDSLEIPLSRSTGELDTGQLAAWCATHVVGDVTWLVASVHRQAGDELATAVDKLAAQSSADWPVRLVTHRDVPLQIKVDEPERVGIDRLLAAVAANRLRDPQRAVITVDLGTATTVDLVDETGAFVGGAILPGIGTSARALEGQTDALPLVDVDRWEQPPTPLGKSTVAAIEAGLFWGAVGAIGELVDRLSAGLAQPPDLLVTGGSSLPLTELLSERAGRPVRRIPHLVLAGIALVDRANREAGC